MFLRTAFDGHSLSKDIASNLIYRITFQLQVTVLSNETDTCVSYKQIHVPSLFREIHVFSTPLIFTLTFTFEQNALTLTGLFICLAIYLSMT